MRRSWYSPVRALPLLVLVVACSEPTTPAREASQVSAPTTSEGKITRVSPASFGEPFPVYLYQDLNPASGTQGKVNLAEILGKRPVVLCYWIAGRSRSERMLQDLERITEQAGSSKLALLGVVRPKNSADLAAIQNRIRELGLRSPVLNDEEFRLGQQLVVRTVPSVSIVDAGGRLRLAGAGSLRQVLEYNMDVEAAIQRVAAKGTLGTYGPLPRYEPVSELVGQKCPDFEAPLAGGGTVRRWSNLLDPKRLNILIFWSVDCPHCKKALPQINDWLKRNPDGINLVSAANVVDDAARAKTEEYCRLSGFIFPTFLDQNLRISETFQVGSTPTVLIVRPDGVVDSVLFGEQDFAKAFETKKRELLGAGAGS